MSGNGIGRTIYKTYVAVVGGAGFLGSHLVQHLIKDRMCKVLVVDNLVAGRREHVHKSADFLHHDITGSEDYLRKAFHSYGVKYVFNYAAYPYVPDSFVRPLRVFDVNATAAIKVINAAQESGALGILQISSAEIYGGSHSECGRINEQFPVMPHSTYGAAKAAVDYYCQVAPKERGTPVISLRQFNCVGERETHPYVIPEIISQISSQQHVGGPVVVRLGNNSFRDFLYAGDAVRAATELLEKGTFGEVYNLGSETGTHIYDLAPLIGGAMGKQIIVETEGSRIRPWEIWHLQSDNTKINSVIKYRPRINLSDAIGLTLQDYRFNGNQWAWERKS